MVMAKANIQVPSTGQTARPISQAVQGHGKGQYPSSIDRDGKLKPAECKDDVAIDGER